MFFKVFADDQGYVNMEELAQDLGKYGDVMSHDEFDRIVGELKKSFPNVQKKGKYRLEHFEKMMFE